jgi:hypothetical protein
VPGIGWTTAALGTLEKLPKGASVAAETTLPLSEKTSPSTILIFT